MEPTDVSDPRSCHKVFDGQWARLPWPSRGRPGAGDWP